ncbi:MAG: DNA-binding response regulator [Betaproteobacteria bacterium]|nr:MAG: DNA-binding response regulator [Betaproteobacteria bacterium]
MSDESLGTIFIVDDTEVIRDSLRWLFESRGFIAQVFESAAAFLAANDEEPTGCAILDVRMPGMTGPELYDEIRRRDWQLPVLFLSGHGDVPMAVDALKKGALDFVEKPFNDNDLVDRVARCLRLDAERRRSAAGRQSVAVRLAQLTSREQEVMRLVLAGKLNKQIAEELHIAMRTVEVHRARVLAKMGVRSAVELAQIVSLKDLG